MRLFAILSAVALIAGCANSPPERPVIPKDRPADRLVAPPADASVWRLGQTDVDSMRGGAAYRVESTEHVLTINPHTNPPERLRPVDALPLDAADAISRMEAIAMIDEMRAEADAELALAKTMDKEDVPSLEAHTEADAEAGLKQVALTPSVDTSGKLAETPETATLSPIAEAWRRYCNDGMGMTGADWEIIFDAEERGIPMPADCLPPK